MGGEWEKEDKWLKLGLSDIWEVDKSWMKSGKGKNELWMKGGWVVHEWCMRGGWEREMGGEWVKDEWRMGLGLIIGRYVVNESGLSGLWEVDESWMRSGRGGRLVLNEWWMSGSWVVDEWLMSGV